MRATVWTLVLMAFAFGGHLLLWACCLPFAWASPGGMPSMEHVGEFQVFALTPPAVMGQLMFQGGELESNRMSWNPALHIGMAVVGLVIWAGITLALWGVASQRFRLVSKRSPMVPKSPPPRRARRSKREDEAIMTVEEVKDEHIREP